MLRHNTNKCFLAIPLFLIICISCTTVENRSYVQDLNGLHQVAQQSVWLTHEHILVDFIGADKISPDQWDQLEIIQSIIPFLDELKHFHVAYFVDATPAYLGRDVLLLKRISDDTGIRIITNTGLYGVDNNKYIPAYAIDMSAEELAEMWINEFEDGIDNTPVRPGFIKIGIDSADPLDPMHEKLVKAAAITHLKTGLPIASHTGKALGLWPQLNILEEYGVSPEAFIWVHAQLENDTSNYLKAIEKGCWISLDGLGWETEDHLEKIFFLRSIGFLDRVLISHDAGWYDPQKEVQSIVPFTNIFTNIIPILLSEGFTDDEINQILSVNPAKAFSLGVRSR